MQAGDCVELAARLYPPQSSLNPGGFDYAAWLLERNIRATGNVVQRPTQAEGCDGAARARLDRVRAQMVARIRAALGDQPYAGVVIALAVGDQDAISSAQWTLFRQTGTSHLFSVSGLHITLFSALVFAGVRALWRRVACLNLRIPARTAGLLLGLLAAACYSAVSGFGIPAQRTVLMLASGVVIALLDRTPSASRVLAAALLIVVLIDPWAAHAPGFWLSFGAVAALLFADMGRLQRPPIVMTWIRTQWAVTLALTPLLLMLFQEVSLVSPLANLVAIPLISLFAVPLSLAAAVLGVEQVASVAAAGAHSVVAAVIHVLEMLVQLPQPLLHAAAPTLPVLLLALLGVAVLLLPRGVPGRWLAWLLFLPLFFPRLPAPQHGDVWLTVFDVGQGEAVLLRTARHALIFDSGPSFASGDDAGARVVAPALWQQGITRLDGLVISHDDLDHSGGGASLLQSHRPAWLLTSLAGVPANSLGPIGKNILRLRPDALTCIAGQSWQWDGVHFEVLHPPAHHYAQSGHGDNARSCVLRVQTKRTDKTVALSALIVGDIERLAEMNLLERGVLRPVNVLVAAHHGSRSSSTPAFLAAAQPEWVLIPVGRRNRYGHPHPEVLARFRALGAEIARTDYDGAIMLRLQHDQIEVQRASESMQRYWHATERR